MECFRVEYIFVIRTIYFSVAKSNHIVMIFISHNYTRSCLVMTTTTTSSMYSFPPKHFYFWQNTSINIDSFLGKWVFYQY